MMDSVAYPPEDPEMLIPTITGSDSSNASSLQDSHPVQIPTICYTPAASALVARRAILADTVPGPPILQGIQYRTICTQVQFAQTTFHYPPTPPVETGDADRGHHSGDSQLPLHQSVIDIEGPSDRAVNPFPSLPTPPDLEAISMGDQNATTVSTPMAAPGDPKYVNSQWQSPSASNFCFMAQQSMLPFGPNAAARRQSQGPTAFYYPMSDKRSASRPIPPLLKEGYTGKFIDC